MKSKLLERPVSKQGQMESHWKRARQKIKKQDKTHTGKRK